nr:hypothetical protein [Geomicrobium sp. JCM 19055]
MTQTMTVTINGKQEMFTSEQSVLERLQKNGHASAKSLLPSKSRGY